jgi:hypothetical protein
MPAAVGFLANELEDDSLPLSAEASWEPMGAANWAELANSAAAFLEPGEEIVVVDEDGAQAVDFWKAQRGTLDQPTPAGVSFGKGQMGVAITRRRFLVFKCGFFGKAQQVLAGVPIGEVGSIDCIGHSLKSFEVVLKLDGLEYRFINAHIGRCRRMQKALAIAQGTDQPGPPDS